MENHPVNVNVEVTSWGWLFPIPCTARMDSGYAHLCGLRVVHPVQDMPRALGLLFVSDLTRGPLPYECCKGQVGG